MDERRFDLIVLGVGMAGLTAAQKCAESGWSVAVVDHQPYGGTCALRGCDPKKLLRRGAELMDGASALSGNGFDLKVGQINWTDLMAHKRSFTEPMPAKIEQALERAGVVRLHGAARLLHPDEVQVNGSNLRARHMLVATGAKPRPLDFPGAEHLIDSTAFLNLDVLPRPHRLCRRRLRVHGIRPHRLPGGCARDRHRSRRADSQGLRPRSH